MRALTLVRRNLAYYRRIHLAVVAGVAVAVSVLAGALLVGHSVRASLSELVLSRLGSADWVVASGGFFRTELARDLGEEALFLQDFDGLAPLIILDGMVTHEPSRRRASGIPIYGVDERFFRFHGTAPPALGERGALVTPGLARELGAPAGDTILVRVRKPSPVPLESLHGRKEDVGRTLRLSLEDWPRETGLREFSLRPQQGAVRAAFVPLGRLQRDLALESRVNTLLVSGTPADPEMLPRALRTRADLEDMGVRLRRIGESAVAVESEGLVLSDALADAARAVALDEGVAAQAILTYLANAIRGGGREIPYSLVSALDGTALHAVSGGTTLPPDGILLNEWAARELGVRPGDGVSLEYYLWEEGGRLETRTAEFRLTGVIPVERADPDYAPHYPGISDTESLADWDPPFPIDLRRIRPEDERYWDRHRTTPKAFIPLARGQDLWTTRYGKLTSVRLLGLDPSAEPAFRRSLGARVDPLSTGFTVYPVKAEGLLASRGATDFGEYFVYFSFFLVVSALLLAGLFFRLGVEQRATEVGVLQAMGLELRRIRVLLMVEGGVLAVLGSALGVAGALAYAGLMMHGLRTWWVEAVGTRLLELHGSPWLLAAGGVGGVAIAFAAMDRALRGLRSSTTRSLIAGATAAEAGPGRARSYRVAVGGAIIGLGLVIAASLGWVSEVGAFFGAGALLLLSLLSWLWHRLTAARRSSLASGGPPGLARLGFLNASQSPGRSLLSVALIASATFIIVAVEAFRRDDRDISLDPRSGTGGYALLAESILPLAHDPNSPAGREALNLEDSEGVIGTATWAAFRLRPGDDASCLNLYRPRNPRILAAGPAFVRSGRFSFRESLAGDEESLTNPWLLLERSLPDGSLPVIADSNSMTYVLHLGLGDVLTLDAGAGEPIRLRLVGALADSLFQGELLMSEENFRIAFPEVEGYRFFLLDAAAGAPGELTSLLEERLSDFGLDVSPTAERLATFHRVENTYLSTFQALGGLGLALGTLGLGAVLLRNVLERRRELAVLRAVGYRSRDIGMLVVAENVMILGSGLAVGTLSAVVAILPALGSRGGSVSLTSLVSLLLAVLLTGLMASLAAVTSAVRAPLLAALREE
jgi:ABC-type lipoprotein release transport system permease subunit